MGNSLSVCICDCGEANCNCKTLAKQTEASTRSNTSLPTSALPSYVTTATLDPPKKIENKSPQSYGFKVASKTEANSLQSSSLWLPPSGSTSSTKKTGESIDTRYGSKIFTFTPNIGENELAKYLKDVGVQNKNVKVKKKSSSYASKGSSATKKQPKSSDSVQKKNKVGRGLKKSGSSYSSVHSSHHSIRSSMSREQAVKAVSSTSASKANVSVRSATSKRRKPSSSKPADL